MPKYKWKNINNNIQVNISPIQPTTKNPEYSNTDKAQKNKLKTNFTMIIEVLEEEINESIREIREKIKKLKEMNKSLKECQEKQEKSNSWWK